MDSEHFAKANIIELIEFYLAENRYQSIKEGVEKQQANLLEER